MEMIKSDWLSQKRPISGTSLEEESRRGSKDVKSLKDGEKFALFLLKVTVKRNIHGKG